MNQILTGRLIASLRREKGLTQLALAEKLGVSDKAVSKWERGGGVPDVSLLPVLAKELGVGMESLLRGRRDENEMSNGNLKKTRFYVCPVCGNLICSSDEAEILCCGKPLEALTPQKPDGAHALCLSVNDGDRFVTGEHEMTKEHYLSFLALVSDDTVIVKKKYPEWGTDTRLPGVSHGILLWYCVKHGLFYQNV